MDERTGTGGDIDHEQIRDRAYEISLGEEGGTPEQNWRRAEQELRGGRDVGTSGGSDADVGGGYGDVGGPGDMSESGDGGSGDAGAPTAGDEPSDDLPGAASP